LFDGEQEVTAHSRLGLEDLAHVICRGGWPESVLAKTPRAAYMKAASYVDEVIHEDVHRVDGVERNPDRVRNVLRSLARNISTLTTAETLLEDLRTNDPTICDKTLASYLNALRKIFVVEDEPAWSPSLKSRLAIRTAAKRQFVDPSIATAVLGATPRRLMNDFRSFGSLFESLCVRDLRVYAQLMDGEVRHYRDQTGLEADMIVALRDGRWGAVEVKLGAGDIDEAVEGLVKLRNKVDVSRMGHPSFLMVLTGTDLGYRRDDGVIVCPLAALKP
jgi:predicted AAA+ superfamily ATPase